MNPRDATRTLPRLGIDLGGTKIEIVALDGEGRELLRRRVATPRGDYGATLDAIARLVEESESALGIVGQASIGIGTPGTHSRATGLMRNCNSVWLNGRPLGADLATPAWASGDDRERRELLRALGGDRRRRRGGRTACSA